METEYFAEYRRLKEAGRKAEATAALHRFLASFGPDDDRALWVREYLEAGDYGHRIRHEIYQTLVFPVLLEGYRRGDAWSAYWLGRTAQNLYTAPALHAQVSDKAEQQLFAEAYDREPREEVRQSLLASLIEWFAYCQHEWPMGILYGIDGAGPEECDELLREVERARSLDRDGAIEPFLGEFERRIREYRRRRTSPR